MSKQEESLKKITSHAKEYGFVFPSSEIYDGLGAIYDYGQNGVELKNNIKQYWWRAMVQLHENIVGLDSGIFMHPKIWKASGHVDSFSDPLIDNKDTKKRFRADVLIEDKIAQLQKKGKIDLAKELEDKFDTCLNDNDLQGLKEIIVEYEINDPETGVSNWGEVKQFNLMFATQMGAVAESSEETYLRPETAQGIFVNFLNVQKTSRQKIPFGIAQIGKAFRNEIVARQFIFRMREFEQMEMQFFVQPGGELEWYEYWKQKRMKWHINLGISPDKYRFHDHIKLAHYANAACDIEYDFPFGFKEVEGIHSRTDFDLTKHQEFSGKKLQYFDPELNKNYIPYVVETSIGADRMFLLTLFNALQDETLPDGSIRTVLNLPPALAPNKLALLPLLKKDGLPELARNIFADLRLKYMVQYDEKDAIGKRYRRQDAIGTPFCITIDHQSLVDETVTIRRRDTMEQTRIYIREIDHILQQETAMETLLKNL
ncbi:MAG: glycine--tRNA ligase [Bacteroidota bacterium]|nr:glycine--tRNA ligase [Bacteroidota bacterium]